MPILDDKSSLKKQLLAAFALIVAGFAISFLSVAEMAARNRVHTAQATAPLQGAPSTEDKKPAESKPGGERPTTPAPEPARPDSEAKASGAKEALPPAPPEKVAPPMNPTAKEK